MNVLFMSIAEFDSIYQHEIYPDLLREFMNNGHEIYVISSLEKRMNKDTHMIDEGHAHILKVRVGNITKSGLLEKGIATVRIESQFISAIKKYYSNIKFDIVMYSTPPITFCNAIRYVKNRDGAKTYLLLKDIFPQNAVDMGMMSKKGIKSLLYRYFRNKEKKLYGVSDKIGCMSQANVDYIIKHNAFVNPNNVEVCPNSVEPQDKSVDEKTRTIIRQKYGIPIDKKVFVYGGNLGKPQGIEFLIKCLESQNNNDDVFFLIVGDGTEYEKLDQYVRISKQNNLKLMKRLPKDDYDTMVGACDVGMIFLDNRFTIPNFPSRILSYMQAKIPVLAVTDINTDIGKVVVDGGFGWWCESSDVDSFSKIVNEMMGHNLSTMGKLGKIYLDEHYSTKQAYDIVISSFDVR